MAQRVLPLVSLMFCCARAQYKQKSATYQLTNPFTKLWMPAGVQQYRIHEFLVYALVSEAAGSFNISIQLRTEGGVIIGTSNGTTLHLDEKNRLDDQEIVFHMKEVVLRAGMYTLVILANHAEVEGATSNLRVFAGVSR
jgi:hypothetical protein